MNITSLASILLAMLFGSPPAIAADGKITISSPMDGAMVAAGKTIPMSYEANVGSSGNHLHLNVDGKRKDVIRELKGTIEIEPLSAGKHRLCLAANTKGHTPTGTETCVNVTAQ